MGALVVAASLSVATPAMATAAAPEKVAATSDGTVHPLNFRYIRSFRTQDECRSYGGGHYGWSGENITWFCAQHSNPDLLPWGLWYDGSV
jgi:hypothetical protein